MSNEAYRQTLPGTYDAETELPSAYPHYSIEASNLRFVTGAICQHTPSPPFVPAEKVYKATSPYTSAP